MRKLKAPYYLAALLFALALAGCSAGAGSPDRGPGRPATPASVRPGGGQEKAGGRRFAAVPVQAEQVRSGALSAQHTTAGSVVPVTRSQVAARVSGVVDRVLHRTGDSVTAGQTVVQLDDTQLKIAVRNAQVALEKARISLSVGQDTAAQANPRLAAQLQSAQAALAAAQKDYDAQQALAKEGGASASQVDNARSQLEQARANVQAAQSALEENRNADSGSIAQLKLAVEEAQNQLQLAQADLADASVKAPFAGQIASLDVAPGMFLSQNTTAFVLVSADRQISFNAPPADAPNLKAGTRVEFTVAGQSVPVRIAREPSAPVDELVPMVAELPASADYPYGTVGTVSYSVTLARGVLVPISALETNDNRYYVYAIAEGKAQMKSITILAETGASAAVRGLAAGDQVIINPPPGLLPGAEVRVVPAGGGASAGRGGQAAPGGGAPSGGGAGRPQQGSGAPAASGPGGDS